MRRVVKIGGSLLAREHLPDELLRWLDVQAEAETLIVVGGGELIDAIRRLDQLRRGDPVETHWICVELLEATRKIVAGWMDWPSINSPAELQQAIHHGFPTDLPKVVSVRAFYARDRVGQGGASVPLDWRTTTDTIAALLAIEAGADELVLLKSCEIDRAATIRQLADEGIVDESLPIVDSQLKSIRIEKI